MIYGFFSMSTQPARLLKLTETHLSAVCSNRCVNVFFEPVNGIAVCKAIGSQYNPFIISDCCEEAVIAWNDARQESETDLFAQRVLSDGTLGDPPTPTYTATNTLTPTCSPSPTATLTPTLTLTPTVTYTPTPASIPSTKPSRLLALILLLGFLAVKADTAVKDQDE